MLFKMGRIAGLCLLFSLSAEASDVKVAVASNFAPTLQEIAARFEAKTHHEVVLSSGSTGKLYSQIVNGAPFDVLLSADQDAPLRLEKEGLTVPGSRFTYAVGELALWSNLPGLVDAEGRILSAREDLKVAIANPLLAPYGKAALQVLEGLGLSKRIESRLIRGENVAQAYQFVATGNASLGFVALSQVLGGMGGNHGSYWKVPSRLHDPLRQDAVLLSPARGNAAAKDFLLFLKSREIVALLRSRGYGG